MDTLVRLLTRESLLVELLVFKLVELRQLLLSGETRFLGWASEEVERATQCVRAAELERAMLMSELGRERGLDDPTLTEMVADAPAPWQGLLKDLQDQLLRHAQESASVLQVTRRLAEAGSRSINETLDSLSGSSPGTYAGATAHGRVQARYGQGF